MKPKGGARRSREVGTIEARCVVAKTSEIKPEEQGRALVPVSVPSRVLQRVVFLALRGEEGQVECLWPVPLNDPQERTPEPLQLRLLGEDAAERVVRAAPEGLRSADAPC